MKLISRTEYYKLPAGSVVSYYGVAKHIHGLFVKDDNQSQDPENDKRSMIIELDRPDTEPMLYLPDKDITLTFNGIETDFSDFACHDAEWIQTPCSLDTFSPEGRGEHDWFVLWEKKDLLKLKYLIEGALTNF